MPKKCCRHGCRKFCKVRTKYCGRHGDNLSIAESRPRRLATSPTKQKSSPLSTQQTNNTRDGVFCMDVSQKQEFAEIERLARKCLADATDDKTKTHNTGGRFICFPRNYVKGRMKKLLLSLTKSVLTLDSARNSPVVCWLQDPAIGTTPAVINAPHVNSRSSIHTHGTLHRDHGGPEEDLLSFEIFLDPVTESTGQVQFWERPMDSMVDVFTPRKWIKKEHHKASLAVGKKGTMYVWNGRIIHRSMPNTDPRIDTLRVHWIVAPTGGTVPVRT